MGNTSKVIVCTLILTLIWLGFYLGNIIVETLVVKRLGPDFLGYIYIISIFSSYLFVNLYIILLQKSIDILKMLVVFLWTIAAVLTLSWFLLPPIEQTSLDLRTCAYFLIQISAITISPTVLVASTWSLIEYLFRPIYLKKVMPLFSGTSLMGGGLSGFLVQFIVRTWTLTDLVLVWSGLLVLCAIIILFFFRHSFGLLKFKKEDHSEQSETIISMLNNEGKYILGKKIAMFMIAIGFLYAMIAQIGIIEMLVSSNTYFNTESDLSIFLAYLNASVCIFVIIFQLIYQNN